MDKKRRLFEEEEISKAVLTLALPTIAATLVTVLYNLVDTYFVGQLNDSLQIAAVTLGGNVTLLFIAVENLFGIGGASIFGRALGLQDEELSRRSSAFSIWWAGISAMVFSLVYWCFQEDICYLIGATAENIVYTKNFMFYVVTLGALPAIVSFVFATLLRTEGKAKVSMLFTSIGVLVNIVLDPFFIYPEFLGMGCAGAGLATLLGNLVACLGFIGYCWRNRADITVTMTPKYLIPTWEVLNNVLEVGIPAAIQNMLNVVGITVLNRLASLYGSDAIAAMGIAYKLYMMPMYIITAFTQGIMPIVSYNFGSGNITRIKSAVVYGVKNILIFSLCVVIGLNIFATDLVRMFLDVDRVVELGSNFTRMLVIGLPLLAIDFGVVAVFQSVGMGRESLYFAIARKALLEIPLFIVLEGLVGVIGLAMATPIAEAVLAVIAVWLMLRTFRKWDIKNGKVKGEMA